MHGQQNIKIILFSQIVCDTDTCLNPRSLTCKKKGCASSDGYEEKEYCLLQFDNYFLQVLTGCRSVVGVCYIFINMTVILISECALNRNMKSRRL